MFRMTVLIHQHLGDFVLLRCSKPRRYLGLWLTYMVEEVGFEPTHPVTGLTR